MGLQWGSGCQSWVMPTIRRYFLVRQYVGLGRVVGGRATDKMVGLQQPGGWSVVPVGVCIDGSELQNTEAKRTNCIQCFFHIAVAMIAWQ